jgi:hypothetical protein
LKSLNILKSKDINPNEPVLIINKVEALERLIEAITEFCPSLKAESMSKNDLEILLDSLGNTTINYHPENYHQERAALLENSKMLQKYGLTDEEIRSLDFI